MSFDEGEEAASYKEFNADINGLLWTNSSHHGIDSRACADVTSSKQLLDSRLLVTWFKFPVFVCDSLVTVT